MTTAERLAAHGIPGVLTSAYDQARLFANNGGLNWSFHKVGDLVRIIDLLAAIPPAPEVPEALRHLHYTPSLSPSTDYGPCWIMREKDVPRGWRWRCHAMSWSTTRPSVMASYSGRGWVEAQPIPAPPKPPTVEFPPLDRGLVAYLASAEFATPQLRAISDAATAALAAEVDE